MKSTPIFLFLLYLLVSSTFQLNGVEDSREDISLGTIIAPKPKVLDFAFDDPISSVDANARRMGMVPLEDDGAFKQAYLRRLVYAGLPQGLLISHKSMMSTDPDKRDYPNG
ncbi:hypothetical protein SCG7109_AE_00010, partial [Chlamydiales bacterium SCGC AG-110-M15]